MNAHPRRGVGRTEILIGVAVVAVLVLITVPLGLSMSKKSSRGEVPLNVEAIRTAELEYGKAFSEGYVAATAAPRPAHAVNTEAVPWAPSDGFRKLSWAPEQTEVFGSYQVMSNSREAFTVVGVCDVDGDGETARFEATHEEGEAGATKMVTPSSVY